jgi:predicted adenylyl cyclase CyaB
MGPKMSEDEKITVPEEVKVEEPKPKQYLEVEYKYNADDIDRIAFKDLAKSLNPKSFIYVESTDVYYALSENEFLRYRMPSENKQGGPEENRAELTFKKKQIEQNNWTRIEVNLRVDQNDPKLIEAFCEGLGYKKNFAIGKACDIYFYDDADIVYYTVKDEDGKYAHFLEIEANEDIGLTHEQSIEAVQKYEKLLLPLGITPQKRKRLSLWEMYRKGFKKGE